MCVKKAVKNKPTKQKIKPSWATIEEIIINPNNNNQNLLPSLKLKLIISEIDNLSLKAKITIINCNGTITYITGMKHNKNATIEIPKVANDNIKTLLKLFPFKKEKYPPVSSREPLSLFLQTWKKWAIIEMETPCIIIARINRSTK